MTRMTELMRQRQAVLDLILEDGGEDGAHHKQWVLDQIVRILTGCPSIRVTRKHESGTEYSFDELGVSLAYVEWKKAYSAGEEGPDTYGEWDEGMAP